jgi:hypothetical protein
MKIYNFFCNVGQYKMLCFTLGQSDAIDRLHQHPHGEAYESGWRRINQQYVPPDDEGYNANAKYGDFVCVHLRPALTERSLKIIGEQFRRWGELLPVTVIDDNSTVYMFNCTTVVDCLDESRSNYLWQEYEFFPDRLTDAEVFYVGSPRAGLFCTESFKQKIEATGLTGLAFRLLWSDEPKTLAAMRADRERREKDEAIALAAHIKKQHEYFQDRTLTAEELAQMRQYADQGYALLGVTRDHQLITILGAIDAAILRYLDENPGEPDDTAQPQVAALSKQLGAVWCEQYIRAFGWHWACFLSGSTPRYLVYGAYNHNRSLYVALDAPELVIGHQAGEMSESSNGNFPVHAAAAYCLIAADAKKFKGGHELQLSDVAHQYNDHWNFERAIEDSKAFDAAQRAKAQ